MNKQRKQSLTSLTIAAAMLVAIAGCTERRSEPAKEGPPPARDVSGYLPGHGPDAPAWSPGAAEAQAPPGAGLSRPMPKGPAEILGSRFELAGTVSLRPGVQAPSGGTLYVFARRPGVPGPPIAVVRIPDPRFPQPFRLGASHAIGGQPFEGDLEVGARLDLDGDVGSQEPGNLTGEYARNPARVGQSGVTIALDRAPDRAGASPGAAAPAAPLAPPAQARPERGATIMGTIRLPPGVKPAPGSVLFIMARPAGQSAGPPIAVKKIAAGSFPAAYVLSNEDAMMPDAPFAGAVSVSARLDSDGNASTREAGDLVGAYARNPARVGDAGVDIELGAAAP